MEQKGWIVLAHLYEICKNDRVYTKSFMLLLNAKLKRILIDSNLFALNKKALPVL